MSLDKSLKSHERLTRRRNVLSREERISRLIEQDRWHEGDSLLGLPKVKPLVVAAPPKARKTKAESEEAGAESAAEQ